ncbi:NUDIX domain-containing protein [Streptomyces sp. NPDC056491]|uniref:NUDIX hydrolase n=1 Tax=Streptomyces sp. NPDC056491 TaxID=3345837 RepID=UPI003675D936
MSSTSDEPQGTAALLVNPRGQYLLHLRDANKPHICDPGTWSIPGGGREGNESAGEAIARELREETGLTVPLEPFTVVDCVGADGRTEGRIQVYLGAWDGDADGLPLTEGIMLRWFDAATTAHLTMCSWTQEVIDRHRARVADPGASATEPAGGPGPGGRACPHIIGVHLYLEHEGRVLLGLRHPDSVFGASHHHLLAGHCERESAIACLIREAREEAGLRIGAADLELAHTVHVVDPPGSRPRMQLVFRAHRWEGTPEVLEPDKCVGWDWWPAKALPEPIVPYARAAIEGIRAGRRYTEMGWS